MINTTVNTTVNTMTTEEATHTLYTLATEVYYDKRDGDYTEMHALHPEYCHEAYEAECLSHAPMEYEYTGTPDTGMDDIEAIPF